MQFSVISKTFVGVSTEMQLVYSTALADWVENTLGNTAFKEFVVICHEYKKQGKYIYIYINNG